MTTSRDQSWDNLNLGRRGARQILRWSQTDGQDTWCLVVKTPGARSKKYVNFYQVAQLKFLCKIHHLSYCWKRDLEMHGSKWQQVPSGAACVLRPASCVLRCMGMPLAVAGGGTNNRKAALLACLGVAWDPQARSTSGGGTGK